MAGQLAAALGAQGRGGDRLVGHLTPGEIVVPLPAQTPNLRTRLLQAMMGAGLDPEHFIVGGPDRRNPTTGLREFRVGDPGSGAAESGGPAGGGPFGGGGGAFGGGGGLGGFDPSQESKDFSAQVEAAIAEAASPSPVGVTPFSDIGMLEPSVAPPGGRPLGPPGIDPNAGYSVGPNAVRPSIGFSPQARNVGPIAPDVAARAAFNLALTNPRPQMPFSQNAPTTSFSKWATETVGPEIAAGVLGAALGLPLGALVSGARLGQEESPLSRALSDIGKMTLGTETSPLADLPDPAGFAESLGFGVSSTPDSQPSGTSQALARLPDPAGFAESFAPPGGLSLAGPTAGAFSIPPGLSKFPDVITTPKAPAVPPSLSQIGVPPATVAGKTVPAEGLIGAIAEALGRTPQAVPSVSDLPSIPSVQPPSFTDEPAPLSGLPDPAGFAESFASPTGVLGPTAPVGAVQGPFSIPDLTSPVPQDLEAALKSFSAQGFGFPAEGVLGPAPGSFRAAQEEGLTGFTGTTNIGVQPGSQLAPEVPTAPALEGTPTQVTALESMSKTTGITMQTLSNAINTWGKHIDAGRLTSQQLADSINRSASALGNPLGQVTAGDVEAALGLSQATSGISPMSFTPEETTPTISPKAAGATITQAATDPKSFAAVVAEIDDAQTLQAMGHQIAETLNAIVEAPELAQSKGITNEQALNLESALEAINEAISNKSGQEI